MSCVVCIKQSQLDKLILSIHKEKQEEVRMVDIYCAKCRKTIKIVDQVKYRQEEPKIEESKVEIPPPPPVEEEDNMPSIKIEITIGGKKKTINL